MSGYFSGGLILRYYGENFDSAYDYSLIGSGLYLEPEIGYGSEDSPGYNSTNGELYDLPEHCDLRATCERNNDTMISCHTESQPAGK